jgi:FtsZ-binding cell division protein ZapB
LVGDLFKKIDELKEDNKKLAKQVDDFSNTPNELRKKCLM